MINSTNLEWLKPEAKPYFHQFLLNCIVQPVDCLGKFNKDEIGTDSSFKMEEQILADEIKDPEFLNFAIENFSELFSYITSGRINIR